MANLLPASARTYWGPADSLPLTSPTNKATTLLWLSPHNGSTLPSSMCYNRNAILVALMGQWFDSGRQKSLSLHHILEEKVSWRLGSRINSPLHLRNNQQYKQKWQNNLFSIITLPGCLWKMTGSPGQTRPLMWINMPSSWEKICKLIFFQIPVGIWWHWVSRGHYLLVLGGTGSVFGGTD